MRFRDRIWTPSDATGLAIPLSEAKAQSWVTWATDDAQITIYLTAAIEAVEKETQRLLSPRSCTLRLPSLPCGSTPVELPGGEVASITSVMADGVPVDPLTYEVVGSSPARLLVLQAWPVVSGDALPVTITYVAGYAVVPAPLKVAVLMLAAEMFRRRTEGETGQIWKTPVGAEMLMQKFRIPAL